MTGRFVAFLRRQPRGCYVSSGWPGSRSSPSSTTSRRPSSRSSPSTSRRSSSSCGSSGAGRGFLGAAASAGFWTWEDVLSAHAHPSVAPVTDWNIAVRLPSSSPSSAVVAELKEPSSASGTRRRSASSATSRIAQEVQARLFPPQGPGDPRPRVPRRVPAGARRRRRLLRLPRARRAAASASPLGDVAGKGLSAALLMASLQGALRSLASLSTASRAEALARDLNAQIHALTERTASPRSSGRSSTRTRRTLTYVNAGHNAPMLLRGVGRARAAQDGGPPLGVFAEARYRQDDDRARRRETSSSSSPTASPRRANAADEEFGEARLERILRDNAEARRRERSAERVARRRRGLRGRPAAGRRHHASSRRERGNTSRRRASELAQVARSALAS